MEKDRKIAWISEAYSMQPNAYNIRNSGISKIILEWKTKPTYIVFNDDGKKIAEFFADSVNVGYCD